MNTMNIATTQILQAAVLGTIAFNAGIKCAPCLDKTMLAMFAGRELGATPPGEASTIRLLKEWQNAWTLANLETK